MATFDTTSFASTGFDATPAYSGAITIDGPNKVIYVNSGVSSLSIRSDVYSGWKRWVVLNGNIKYLQAMRSIGGDPIGGGLFAGDLYFLMNGWKLAVDFTQTKVTGVLYSDDYPTPYYTLSLTPQYAASVSALVSGISTTGSGSSSGLTTAESAAILGSAQAAQILTQLTILNEGIKKASLLVPHTANIS